MGKTARLETRLSESERALLDEAALISGVPVSRFVISAATSHAEQVIATRATTVVPAAYFDRLLTSLDEPDTAEQLSRKARESRTRGRIRQR